MSLGQQLYQGVTSLALPLLHWGLAWRERRGKEDPERLHERFGYAGFERPAGKLVLVHAASVGEAMSVLLLLKKLTEHLPQTHFLITSGTVTSAKLLSTRLPPRTMHQFAPLDAPSCVTRFIDHWRPDMALWVESELWPNMLAALRRHRIPAALLNARISVKSQRNWRYARHWIAEMLDSFMLCIAQTEAMQQGLRELGAHRVSYCGNLKFAALPLPDNDFSRTKLMKAIGERPVWLFASSHLGEEEIALAAHQLLIKDFPSLLTIIAPRHPARGDKIMSLIAQKNIAAAQRSLHQEPDAHCSVYLADTLGELGVFYRLCPIAVVGGSFVPVGGHNPIEPALLGCAVGFGPLMPNFSEVASAMLAANAARQLHDAASIAAFVSHMMRDAAARQTQANSALAYAMSQGQVHDRVIATLAPLIAAAELS